MLRLDDVVVSVGATMMLDRVSLQIGRGAPTAIIGPNGSGKTTLLRVVMGLIEHASGDIQMAAATRARSYSRSL